MPKAEPTAPAGISNRSPVAEAENTFSVALVRLTLSERRYATCSGVQLVRLVSGTQAGSPLAQRVGSSGCGVDASTTMRRERSPTSTSVLSTVL